MRIAIIGEQSTLLALQLGRHRIRWVVDSQPDTRNALRWATCMEDPYNVFLILPFQHHFWDASCLAMCLKLHEHTRNSRVALVMAQSIGAPWRQLISCQPDAIIDSDTFRLGMSALADRLMALTQPRYKNSRIWPVDSHTSPA